MNKRMLALLLTLALLCAAFGGAQAISFSSYGLVTKSDTVLLGSASSAGKVVALLPEATLVQVLDQTQTGSTVWYQITDGSHSGFVAAANIRLLTLEEAAALAPAGDSNNNYNNYSNPDNDGNAYLTARLRGYSYRDGYQYLYFGNYPYTDGGSSQPILWRVLAVSGGQALLWSEYILDCRPYIYQPYENAELQTCEFIYSAVYAFLNGQFIYRAFTTAEQNALVGTERGLAFVLNRQELTNSGYGFQASRSVADANRSAVATPYANAMGCFVDKNGGSNYWVSTLSDVYVGNMHYNGSMGNASAYRDNIGIRVACWVDVSALPLYSGNGTQASPFR